MKKILQLLVFTFFACSINAQSCTPDAIYADSIPGVFPLPVPLGPGIENPACVNLYYEHVLHVNVPETYEINNITVTLDYFKFEMEGAMINLPDGIDYACNPPSCDFVGNTVGCIILYGTPTAGSTGTYDLRLGGEISGLNGALVIADTIPGGTLIDGNYYLEVLEEGNTNCMPVFANNLPEGITEINLTPNPVYHRTTLDITLEKAADFNFTITDLTGKIVENGILKLMSGAQKVDFDVSRFANGLYVLHLQNELSSFSTKFIKGK